jgi:hypothetical protein
MMCEPSPLVLSLEPMWHNPESCTVDGDDVDVKEIGWKGNGVKKEYPKRAAKKDIVYIGGFEVWSRTGNQSNDQGRTWRGKTMCP